MTFQMVGTPWAHQLEAFEKAKSADNFAFFAEVGTGKTLMAIMLARYKMFLAGRPMRLLVIAPPIVLKNWKNELLAFSKIPDSRIEILFGPGKKRAEVLKDTAAQVIVTNYESLLMDPVLAGLIAWAPEIIIADEVHKLKSIEAQRTKRAITLSAVAKHRLVLTGTPVLKNAMDLFSQYLFMDRGKTFGTNFYSFRAAYFTDRNAGMPKHAYFPNWQLKKGATQEITAVIKKSSFVVKKVDCLDLPPLVKVTIPVELSPEQRKLYTALCDDLVAYVDDKACVARLALTKALRLMQILSGHIVLEGKTDGTSEVRPIKDNPRSEALRDLVEDINESGKIIIWCAFRADYHVARTVCDGLGLKTVEITGEVSANDKFAAVEAFQKDETVRVCIANPAAGGVGITLTAAPYSIYYSRNFSLEADIQSEARNYRAGSEIHASVTRYDLVAEGTFDEVVLQRISQKLDMSETILNDLRGLLGKNRPKTPPKNTSRDRRAAGPDLRSRD